MKTGNWRKIQQQTGSRDFYVNRMWEIVTNTGSCFKKFRSTTLSTTYKDNREYEHDCCQGDFRNIKLGCLGLKDNGRGYVGWAGGYIEIDGNRYCEGRFARIEKRITIENGKK